MIDRRLYLFFTKSLRLLRRIFEKRQLSANLTRKPRYTMLQLYLLATSDKSDASLAGHLSQARAVKTAGTRTDRSARFNDLRRQQEDPETLQRPIRLPIQISWHESRSRRSIACKTKYDGSQSGACGSVMKASWSQPCPSQGSSQPPEHAELLRFPSINLSRARCNAPSLSFLRAFRLSVLEAAQETVEELQSSTLIQQQRLRRTVRAHQLSDSGTACRPTLLDLLSS